jgi:hypothetical protein
MSLLTKISTVELENAMKVKIEPDWRCAMRGWTLGVVAMLGINGMFLKSALAEQPRPPCHPNPNAAAGQESVRTPHRLDATEMTDSPAHVPQRRLFCGVAVRGQH